MAGLYFLVNSVGAVYDANIGTYYPCVNANSCATKISTTGCATGFYVAESTLADKVTAYSNSASFLTLFAPSNQAYTADIVGSGGYSTGDFYPSFGGPRRPALMPLAPLPYSRVPRRPKPEVISRPPR